MKNERTWHIVLVILCFAAGLCMIINAVTDINYLDVVFYVIMGLYWIVFGIYIYMSRKKNKNEDIEKTDKKDEQ